MKKYAMLCALMHAALRFETWSHNLLRSQALMCCPVSCTYSMLFFLFVLVRTDLPAGRVHGWWRKLVMWINWSLVASWWRRRGCILNRKHPRMMRCWNCMVVKHDAQTPIRVGRIVVVWKTKAKTLERLPLKKMTQYSAWNSDRWGVGIVCHIIMVVKHDAQTPIRVGRIVFFQTGSDKRKQKPLKGFHGRKQMTRYSAWIILKIMYDAKSSDFVALAWRCERLRLRIFYFLFCNVIHVGGVVERQLICSTHTHRHTHTPGECQHRKYLPNWGSVWLGGDALWQQTRESALEYWKAALRQPHAPMSAVAKVLEAGRAKFSLGKPSR